MCSIFREVNKTLIEHKSKNFFNKYFQIKFVFKRV